MVYAFVLKKTTCHIKGRDTQIYRDCNQLALVIVATNLNTHRNCHNSKSPNYMILNFSS